MDMKRQSKLLSLILRHDPAKAGLELRPGGWVKTEDLLAGLARLKRPMSDTQLRELVETNDKKRFSLSEDGSLIRAAQGHSTKVDMKMSPVTPPTMLFHGTATRFLEAILAGGLKPMSRQHVHLSADIETATKVGMRHGKPTIMRVRSEEMHQMGRLFYQADNGVWLTDKVAPEFLELNDERGREK